MSAIYEDLRASRTGFKLYYDESESESTPLILQRHAAPYHASSLPRRACRVYANMRGSVSSIGCSVFSRPELHVEDEVKPVVALEDVVDVKDVRHSRVPQRRSCSTWALHNNRYIHLIMGHPLRETRGMVELVYKAELLLWSRTMW